eukprot:GEMP01007434.1.p1 GENE.GEMP01007434.1~~GEMP01007434.1.p1  ORF type:complete len:1013 (+),score=242.82 GEMP01007434.1:163-3201(+)
MMQAHLGQIHRLAITRLHALKVLGAHASTRHLLTSPLNETHHVATARAHTRKLPLNAAETQTVLAPNDTFLHRHIGPSDEQIQQMLATLGVSDLEQLISETVPASIRRKEPMDMHEKTMSESHALRYIEELMNKNASVTNFIGMGYHGTITPPVIQRNVLEDPGWYTAYTPYQAEISQGRLESLVNFQTLVADLTQMDVSNAGLLDEGTAAAEAMSMVRRAVTSKKKTTFFISNMCHPQTIDVVKTRAEFQGISVVIGDLDTFDLSKKHLLGALVQYPDTSGRLRDYGSVADTLHENGAMLVAACDPMALTVASPPGAWGADVAIGSMQRFGVPMLNGGPASAYMACSSKHIRRMPGRLIGVSRDATGEKAYRLALQTREQHIRLDKATSNVCTAQVLLANMSAMYAVYHGGKGLQTIATRIHGFAQLFAEELQNMGVPVAEKENFFDQVTFNVEPMNAVEVVEEMARRGMNLRVMGASQVSASFDEAHKEVEVYELLAALSDTLGITNKTGSGANVTGELPEKFRREATLLPQDIFNSINSETEMLRYISKLEKKDLSLMTSMITLGSCTMKLNSTSSLIPVSWSQVSNIHPFAPQTQMKGYREMLHQLERYLCTITAFDACSLQPQSGAQGEFAGLLAIRKYHESQGEQHRNICIIPRSAHGTNPASANMMGMQIKWIDDSAGMDLDALSGICEEYSDDLSALMITYPSTHGVFETNIVEICDLIHKHGGKVYMDGANMNAQMGITAPGLIGADVCHLNLHKTFSIPHGGGGPGMGPICCTKDLAPFLPSHSVSSPVSGGNVSGAVASAPYGQAGIAVIPWMYITMCGAEGIAKSAEMAILNANYMKKRLEGHYRTLSSNVNGRCSHEFIIDVGCLRDSTGISEEDISKRLIDYGFHAPTMSWPVHRSLMVEPTESEDKGELDRFCDAMISIREEIAKIESGEWSAEDNPLKNAPHSQKVVCASEWNHCYTREEAAFPAPWVHTRGKFWPSVGRVDNAFGDRTLILRHEE